MLVTQVLSFSKTTNQYGKKCLNQQSIACVLKSSKVKNPLPSLRANPQLPQRRRNEFFLGILFHCSNLKDKSLLKCQINKPYVCLFVSRVRLMECLLPNKRVRICSLRTFNPEGFETGLIYLCFLNPIPSSEFVLQSQSPFCQQGRTAVSGQYLGFKFQSSFAKNIFVLA